jgi:hypothetical protein
MKTLYALCLVTLLAVLVDVVLFHSRAANAQNTGNYKVVPVSNWSGKSFSLTGTVIGFSCVEATGSSRDCYALTKE